MVRAVYTSLCLWMGAGGVSGRTDDDDAMEGRRERDTLCIGIPVGGVLRTAAVLHSIHQTCDGGTGTAADTLLELCGNMERLMGPD